MNSKQREEEQTAPCQLWTAVCLETVTVVKVSVIYNTRSLHGNNETDRGESRKKSVSV